MSNSKRFAIIFLPIMLLFFSTPCLNAQTAPTAGLSFDSLRAGYNFGAWQVYLTNTSTGNPTSWEYRATHNSCPTLPCVTYGSFNTSVPATNAILNVQIGSTGTVRIWQIVTNNFGADTSYIDVIIDCQHLTSPSVQEIHYYTNLPFLGASAYSNIWVNTTEITIHGRGLQDTVLHSFNTSVSNTAVLPGLVWACGYYYSSNCFSTLQVCDSINIPCWRPPVVVLGHVSNGLQASFSDSVVATNGATWLWDFGDGNTSTNSTSFLAHSYASPGIYNACLTIVDTCGSTTQCTTVNVGSTALSPTNLDLLKLYPNPNDGRFTVQGKAPKGTRFHYLVQDLQSKTLVAGTIPIYGAEIHEVIEVHLPAGIYFIRFQDEYGSSCVQRLVLAD